MKSKKPPKRFAWNPKNQTLYRLMSSTPGVILINWVFQGMLGMDKSELVFHILFDLFLAALCFAVFSNFLSSIVAILLALLVSHTLNWILNSHFWVMGRYIGISQVSEQTVFNYISRLEAIFRSRKSLQGLVVTGKLTRGGGVSSTSDLDVRLIRHKGLQNAVWSNCHLLKEKIFAFLQKFPLDVYLYPDVCRLSELREDEVPIVLKDDGGFVAEWYRKHQRQIRTWEKKDSPGDVQKAPKLCIVCSGGGHLTEAKLSTVTLGYPRYYVTFYSPHHKHSKDIYYHVINPYRNPARFVLNFLQSLGIFLKEMPDVIITTGASVVISTCLIAKLFRKKIIFVESSGNPLTPSATGRFLYPVADVFYVQWQEQLRYFPKARWVGSLL